MSNVFNFKSTSSIVQHNIVKHQLHVCLELVAGQRGGGELCLERF